MEGILPKEIIQKKKHGMGLPIARWFKTDQKLSELLESTLFCQNPLIGEYIQPAYLKTLRSLFETDTTSYYGDTLWLYLVLELWLRSSKETWLAH